MGTILLPKEVIAPVVELIPLLVRGILHDEALLLQALADVCVHILEPLAQLRILISIPVDLVYGFEEVVKGGVVGEAFDQSL